MWVIILKRRNSFSKKIVVIFSQKSCHQTVMGFHKDRYGNITFYGFGELNWVNYKNNTFCSFLHFPRILLLIKVDLVNRYSHGLCCCVFFTNQIHATIHL